MNWYKKANTNEEIKQFFSNFLWEELKATDGNWNIDNCRTWKSMGKAMAYFSGFAPNSLGTQQGYFTGTIVVSFTENYAMKSGEIGMYGMIYEGKKPNENWRANSLFEGADPEMQELPDIKIHSLEEISSTVEDLVNIFWGNDGNDNNENIMPPSMSPEVDYELV